MNMRPDIISADKASSHPLKPGRFYTGTVKSVDERGAISVHILELGSTFDGIIPLNTTPNSHYSVGDSVKCSFADEFFTELIVFGSSRIRANIYPTLVEYDTLFNLVTNLIQRVEELEGA
jgi:hypothetical protein